MNQIRLGNWCFQLVWKPIAGGKQGQVGYRSISQKTARRAVAYLLIIGLMINNRIATE
ncbi:MAG: hypothetical protein LBG58_17170 [Planctomycetaceae bacterium]|nr:hypothetical protein [Planctomycetaceae bacterium]